MTARNVRLVLWGGIASKVVAILMIVGFVQWEDMEQFPVLRVILTVSCVLPVGTET